MTGAPDDEAAWWYESDEPPGPPAPVLDDEQRRFIRTALVDAPSSISVPEAIVASLSAILKREGASEEAAAAAARIAFQWTAHAVRFGKANPPGDVAFNRKSASAVSANFRRILWAVGNLDEGNYQFDALVRAEIADAHPAPAREPAFAAGVEKTQVAEDLRATMRTFRRFEMVALSNKLAGWRPAKAATFEAMQKVAEAYRAATGARIGYTQVAATNRLTGPFVTFAHGVARAAGAPMFFSDAMIKRVRDKRQKAAAS